MSIMSGPAEWKLRVVGAAAGGVSSGSLALLLSWTIVGLYIGLVGIPVGAITGAIFAPRLIRAQRPAGGVVRAAIVACVIGVVGLSSAVALVEGRGASIIDLIEFAALLGLFLFGPISLVLGLPMALAAATVATWWGRRAVRHVERLWLPAVVVVLTVAVSTAVQFAGAVRAGGTEAARRGDQVSAEYRIHNDFAPALGSPRVLLEARSYWDGKRAGAWTAGVGTCGQGKNTLQESDWGFWIGRDGGRWQDRPDGDPVVTNEDYGPGPVRLTITIAPDGTATWERGIHGPPCA
jgi:hypothetical protein